MRTIALIIGLAFTARAQSVYGALTALPGRTTRAVLGKGAQAYLWRASLCAGAEAVQTPQELLLIADSVLASGVEFLPNDLATAVMVRQAAKDPRSVIGSNGDAVLGLISSATTAAGIVAKSPNATYAGLGMTAIGLVLKMVAQQKPDAAPYLARLLPKTIALPPNGCDSWYLVASPTPNLKPIKISIP